MTPSRPFCVTLHSDCTRGILPADLRPPGNPTVTCNSFVTRKFRLHTDVQQHAPPPNLRGKIYRSGTFLAVELPNSQPAEKGERGSTSSLINTFHSPTDARLQIWPARSPRPPRPPHAGAQIACGRHGRPWTYPQKLQLQVHTGFQEQLNATLRDAHCP